MATPILEVPEAESRALSSDIQSQLSQLPSVIDSPDTYRRAKESLPILKRAEDKVTAFFKDIKDAAFKAHRAITTKETEQLTPIRQARMTISNLIYSYEREQERIRREAEQKAAEEERRRREDEALRAAAAAAETSPEVADQILEQEIAAPAPVVILPSSSLEVVGVSSRANWTFKYSGCASGLEWDRLSSDEQQRIMRLLPREFCRPDERLIRAQVKAMKGGTRIPGVEVYDAGTIAVRG